jgi:hypothetical protein
MLRHGIGDRTFQDHHWTQCRYIPTLGLTTFIPVSTLRSKPYDMIRYLVRYSKPIAISSRVLIVARRAVGGDNRQQARSTEQETEGFLIDQYGGTIVYFSNRDERCRRYCFVIMIGEQLPVTCPDLIAARRLSCLHNNGGQ